MSPSLAAGCYSAQAQTGKMTMLRLLYALVLAVAASVAQPRYSVTQTGDVVQLTDARTATVVSMVAPLGNVYQMVVKGQNVIRTPFADVSEFRARPGLSGIPLLAPFANRLDEPAFYANGRKYAFDMELGNVRGPIPIHGFLAGAADWKLIEAKADGSGAWATCTLEFYRYPQWMKQFPFAHTLTITYRLEDGVLEVRTRIDNLSAEAMPVSIGFHPYFQLTDSARDDWMLSVPARTHWRLAANKIPTGETEPVEQVFPDPHSVALRNYDLDHVFGDLARDKDGRAVMSVRGKTQQLDVLVGPNYRALVLYAPNRDGQNFIAIEPMAAITDAMNLAQKGLYKELQSIAPGGSWQESFWIRPLRF
jgi:aldose 1-epimerase